MDEVARGAADPLTALARYEEGTRLLPWRRWFAPVEATNRLFGAATAREARTRRTDAWRCARCGFVLASVGPVPRQQLGPCLVCGADAMEPVLAVPRASDC